MLVQVFFAAERSLGRTLAKIESIGMANEPFRIVGADPQLVVSSSVSMLVPLTIGKLIDFFSNNQVRALEITAECL